MTAQTLKHIITVQGIHHCICTIFFSISKAASGASEGIWNNKKIQSSI